MEEQTDKSFIKTFSMVVVGLTLFTVTIIFLANIVGFKEDEDIPSRAIITTNSA